MSNYLIDRMTWSYSRVKCYESCPYQFYLKYIEELEEQPMFYSSYGSFAHKILAQYHNGEITPDDAVNIYLRDFRREVQGEPQSPEIFSKFFSQGLSMCRTLRPILSEVLAVEQKVSFMIDKYSFVGYVDLFGNDSEGNLCIVDHKSRNLKPRSNRKKPTQSDELLDEYLRQLAMYAIPLSGDYGKVPNRLVINCYKTNTIISEEQTEEQLEKRMDEVRCWAVDTIHQIEEEKQWRPNVDFYYCRYLCGLRDQCEYARLGGDW